MGGIVSLFTGPPGMPDPKPPPSTKDESLEEAKIRERLLAARRRGRASTILTNEKVGTNAPVKRKTLLGE